MAEQALLPHPTGTNLPVEFIEADPDLLRTRLERDYAKMLTRFAELNVGAGQAPQFVENEAAAQRIVDWVGQQVRPATEDAKKAHAREKKPYLDGGKTIDTFFLRRIDKLNLAVGVVISRAEEYFAKKKAELRRREVEERNASPRQAARGRGRGGTAPGRGDKKSRDRSGHG